MTDAGAFYICDLRLSWRHKKFVTFWRPNDCGYAFPLPWAGKYTLQDVLEDIGYYWGRNSLSKKSPFIRFPVPCSAVDAIAVTPPPGVIDGDVGPVVPMTAETRRYLRANMLAVLVQPAAPISEAAE